MRSEILVMKGRHQFKRRFSLQPSFMKDDSDEEKSSRGRGRRLERHLERESSESGPGSNGETATNRVKHKIVVMGSPRTGKSSIIQQFLYNTFSSKYKRTIEEMHHGDFEVNGVHLTLEILDTSGENEFPAMRNLSISNADAFILVYDICDISTFEDLQAIRDQILETKGSPVVPIVVVGNKLDLAEEGREVELSTTESVVTVDWENGFVEASAKDGTNISKIFKELLNQAKVKYNLSPALRRKRRQSLPPPNGGGGSTSAQNSPAIPSLLQLQHLEQIREKQVILVGCICFTSGVMAWMSYQQRRHIQLKRSSVSQSSMLCFVESGNGKDLFDLETDYNKNVPPGKSTEVSISLFINRVSAVDENKEVYWEDPRIRITDELDYVELTWQQRDRFWVPDLYIRQLREMKVLLLFQEMTSVRLYKNSTMRVSIGATIMIKCDMDFVLYPLDVQKCAVDFSSYKYTSTEMIFKWREDPPLNFPSDFGDGYRLPKYVVSFTAEKDMHFIYYGEGNHSTARMLMTMSREVRSHLLESYLPSTLFVIMSWGSFVVMPEIVPGRMVLLVTTLLSLVTMFDTVRNNSPNALELKCIEVWIISCTLFVFLSLLEYFVVLFGMRYEKHWRHKKKDLERLAEELSRSRLQASVGAFQAPRPTVTNDLVGNHAGPQVSLPSINHGKMASSTSNEMVDNLRMFAAGKVVPVPEKIKLSSEQREAQSEVSPRNATQNPPAKRKFLKVAEYAVLYCGSQRGTLDQVSLVLFPFCFLLFAVVYWISYVNESRKRMQQ